MIQELRQKGFGTQVHYIPVYQQPYYQQILGDVTGAFPNVERYYQKCLSLPLYPEMTDEDVAFVIETITETITGR